jgi:O-antigen/teichoic acid export membrane protein
VAAIPIGLAYLLLAYLLLGLQDVRGFNRGEVLQRAVPVGLLLAMAPLREVSVHAALVLIILGPLCGFVFVYRRLANRIGSKIATSVALFRSSLQYSLKAYLGSLFAFTVLRSDLFLVDRFRGAAEAGYYSVAANIADGLALLASAVAAILFPKLSALSDVGEKMRFTFRAAAGTALFMVPILGAGCVLAKPFVEILFGKDFLPAVPAFLGLAPGIFALSIETVMVQFLNSIGCPKSVPIIWAAAALMNVSLNLFAVPRWGILGASLVSSVCYMLVSVLVAIAVAEHSRARAQEMRGAAQ